MSEPQTGATHPEPEGNGTGRHDEVPAFFAPPEEPKPVPPPAPTLSALDLHSSSVAELARMARELQIPHAHSMRKRGLIFNILATQTDSIRTSGLAELMPDGFAFLRGPEAGYLPGNDDIYISPALVRRHDMRPGDTVLGIARPPRDGERYFTLDEVETINLVAPEQVRRKSFYDDLTPLHPDERFNLEHDPSDVCSRILDMLCPLGKGQRALIVSPPRAGKTVLLQSLAHAITANHPDTILLVLLIDERPEEVTEMTRSVRGEVLSSTFDEPATRHVQVAEAVVSKARRLAEQGKDVVILLDSITRLARAYNTTCPPSGRILSGGVDANALQKPKRFFGAARNLEEGGSLTILATALIDTGSRMDDVIFEEFKGTGNAEIVLDRKLADRRIWPAIDINRSGTRKEDLLLSKEVLQRVWTLRKVLAPLDPAEGIQLLTRRLAQTPSNAEFLSSMKVAGE